MKKILIVEDEHALRTPLAEALTNAGYTVYTASDGEEGLATALSKQPNLILLDIAMPVMDGLAMLKMLRQNPWGTNVPIIMLTNLSDSYKLKEAMNYNVEQYLVKADWKLKDIITKVDNKLKESDKK
jgi:two-component system alkaline phosphatase synthesis response regulator PhoP